HVGVIVLARQLGGEGFADPGAAAAGLAIDGDRDADARATDGDPALGLTRCHRARELAAELGIIDAFGAVCAEVAHIMALVAQPRRELILEQVPGMIGGKSDAHATLPSLRRRRTPPGETQRMDGAYACARETAARHQPVDRAGETIRALSEA